jgi:hypothetical protein
MTTEYLIAHIGHTIKDHEHITWWKPNGCGYTVCIDKAGLYPEQHALDICRYGLCVAVPKAVAELDARSTPYFRRSDGRLAKLYDGDHHRVVPNSLGAWKHLLSGRLPGCSHPDKPTPISVKKARAIYLDGTPA